jgi:exo-poly-alpha-galacturonosidase
MKQFSLPLALLTLITLAATPHLPAASARWLVTEHGAVGDGATMNTKAIQDTIDQCAASGGGVVVVSKGIFFSGAIFFKQGVNLLIEKDGILKGSTNSADYPQVQTRWEGNERLWTSAFVNFFNMTNVTLFGEGMIDGSGTEFPRGGPRRAPSTNAPVAEVSPATNNAPRTTGGGGRPRLIAFQSCQDVRVSGLHFKDEASWCLFMVYCKNVLAENLVIRAAHTIPSSDGMDIDSCNHVHVTGCDIDCNDDCISIKCGKDDDGRRVNRPSENILIEKTRFGYGQGGIAMGSEVTGGIHHVEVRDCVFEDGNWAPIRFKSQPSRGGLIDDITYRDCQLHGTREAFEFNMEWRMVSPTQPPAKLPTEVRNVKLINITGTANSVGSFHGTAADPITGVTFTGCEITAPRGLTLEHTRDVDTSGLKINGVTGDAITLRGDNAAPVQTPKAP